MANPIHFSNTFLLLIQCLVSPSLGALFKVPVFLSLWQMWDFLILSASKGNDSQIKSNRGAKLSVLTSKDKNES